MVPDTYAQVHAPISFSLLLSWQGDLDILLSLPDRDLLEGYNVQCSVQDGENGRSDQGHIPINDPWGPPRPRCLRNCEKFRLSYKYITVDRRT